MTGDVTGRISISKGQYPRSN